MYRASFASFFGIELTQNVKVQNVIGFEGGIRFELAPPVAVLRLRGEHPVAAAGDCLFDLRFEVARRSDCGSLSRSGVGGLDAQSCFRCHQSLRHLLLIVNRFN